MTKFTTVAAGVALMQATSLCAAPKGAAVAHYDRAADPHAFTVFMQDGGWCWFQDPRAIIQNDHLVMGSVKGNGTGPALIGSYDLKAGKKLGNFMAKDHFKHDDHNAPAFYKRPDGSLLSVYAKHIGNKFHYYRISESADFTQWSAEKTYDHSAFLVKPNDKVTYMNLYNMSAEGRLYCFYRGLNFNPSFMTSRDQGLTWEGDTHFIQNEVGGRQRPYVRYAGNGVDTVHVSFTDAHPRQFGNSLYYAAFRGGTFYRADGSPIKDLATEGALRPSEADKVYQGGGAAGKDTNAAWCSSVVEDAQGRPHMGYSVHRSRTDHRYRIASWDGARWVDREVAYGGKGLYPRESSYTGLITLDPQDPGCVFISTDVNPSTGEDLGGKHEIYRARIGLNDDISTIQWQAVTENSPVRNLRPVILRDGAQRVVLWNRGDYQSYIDYDLDTVGLVETVK